MAINFSDEVFHSSLRQIEAIRCLTNNFKEYLKELNPKTLPKVGKYDYSPKCIENIQENIYVFPGDKVFDFFFQNSSDSEYDWVNEKHFRYWYNTFEDVISDMTVLYSSTHPYTSPAGCTKITMCI
jgi:hypothetical protein